MVNYLQDKVGQEDQVQFHIDHLIYRPIVNCIHRFKNTKSVEGE